MTLDQWIAWDLEGRLVVLAILIVSVLVFWLGTAFEAWLARRGGKQRPSRSGPWPPPPPASIHVWARPRGTNEWRLWANAANWGQVGNLPKDPSIEYCSTFGANPNLPEPKR